MKNSSKKISRLAGILIVLGIVVGVLSIVPSVDGEDYLKEVYANRSQVLIGACFQFLLVPIYIGFSLLIYQVVRDFSSALSIGFVGFRFVAATFQIIGMIQLPIFILLSQKYITDVSSNLIFYETAGEMLKLFRDLTNHLGVMCATGLGNLILHYIFFKGNYVPVWLSLWGMAGNTLLIVSAFLLLFQFVEVVSAAYAILTMPLVLQEVVLAVWLIVKGLRLPVLLPKAEKNY